MWADLTDEFDNHKQQIQQAENHTRILNVPTDSVEYPIVESFSNVILPPLRSAESDIFLERLPLPIPILDLDNDLWGVPYQLHQSMDVVKDRASGTLLASENIVDAQTFPENVLLSDDEVVTSLPNNVESSLLWQEEEATQLDVTFDISEQLDLEAELLAMELAEEQYHEQEEVHNTTIETSAERRGRAAGWMGSCSILYIDWSNEEQAQQEALERLGYARLSLSKDTRAFVIQAARASSLTSRQERHYISQLINARTSLAVLSTDSDSEEHEEQRAALHAKIKEIENFLVYKMQWAGIKKAPRFLGKGLEIDDLIQYAMLGVIQGVHAYDPSRSTRLLVSVNWHVFAWLNRAIANYGRLIGLPAYLHEQLTQLRKQRLQLESDLGRFPTNAELAESLQISMPRVEEMLRFNRKARSLDNYKMREHMYEGYSFQQVDSALLLQEDDIFQEEVEQSDLKQTAEELLGDLTPREQTVLTMRYDLNNEVGRVRTLEEVGQELKVTRERVRQIEEKAFGKILAQFGLRKVKNGPHHRKP